MRVKADRFQVFSPSWQSVLPRVISILVDVRADYSYKMTYLFQFLDKAALGYTAILGLNTDLSLTGQDFSWASAIYYIGYLVASYPAGWLIVRYPVAKVITGSV